MEALKSKTKLVWWPTPQDYNEAVQNPATTFSDPVLQDSEILVGSLGLPRPICGAFASVYRMRSGNDELAVRCFLQNVADQEARYQMLSEFIQSDSLPYTVGFDFQADGLQIRDSKFPVLKMDWVHGQTLEQFVVSNLSHRDKLADVAAKFLQMCRDLSDAGVAHGDLQHGNIIVTANGDLRLVDYDGMYVPAMNGLLANELGHRNYQHPHRDATHFGPYLDNFSAWVIYASLRILSIDPSLFSRLGGGDESILFKKGDFLNPRASARFAILEAHESEEIRSLSKIVRFNLGFSPEHVVPPSDVLFNVEVEPLPSEAPDHRLLSNEESSLPDWLKHELETKSTLPDWMLQNGGRFVTANTAHLSHALEPELMKAAPRAIIRRSSRLREKILSCIPRSLSGSISSEHILTIIGLVALMFASPPLFGWLLFIGGLIFLFMEVVHLCRQLEDELLVSCGEAATAEITSVGKDFYHYKFSTRSGRLIDVQREDVERSTIEAIVNAPKRLTVLYDHTDPEKKHVLYPLAIVRAVP